MKPLAPSFITIHVCILAALQPPVFARCVPVKRDVVSSSSPPITIGTNNPNFEFYEREQMSFNCTLQQGGVVDHKRHIVTLFIEAGKEKTDETFQGVEHASFQRNATAADNNRTLRCEARRENEQHLIAKHRESITVFYSPRPVDDFLDANGTYRATGDFKVGEAANLTVRFRANPRPYLANWKLNGTELLNMTNFRPADQFVSENGSLVAVLQIMELEESNFKDEFQLDIVNDYGSFNVIIKLNGNVPNEQPGTAGTTGSPSNSWTYILAFAVVVAAFSISTFFVWRQFFQNSASQGIDLTSQATDAMSTEFYLPQKVKNQEGTFQSCSNYICNCKTSEIAIVEGASGMGKSKCLHEMQKYVLSEKPEWRTVNLHMRIFRSEFAEKLSSASQAVDLVSTKLQLDDKLRRVFKVKARKELVLYLFDDVNCIEILKLETVVEFFQHLGKVIVTTSKPFTVQQINAKTYVLQPLDDAQQEEFMEKLGCTQSMRIKRVKRDFDLGVPLYLLMTTLNAIHPADAELPEEISLIDIYKRFLDNALCEKKETHNQDQLLVCLYHQAIASVFDEQISEQGEELIRDLALTCVINGRTTFTHSSFAEYLTACALVKRLTDGSEKIVIAKTNLLKILISEDLQAVRHFANNIITNLQDPPTTVHVECSDFLEGLVCESAELATVLVKERLFSLSKELTRNGLSLDFNQELQLGPGNKEFPVVFAAMEASKDPRVTSTSADLVRFLKESGSPLNAFSEKGETALHIAIKASNEPLVHLLLQLGANVQMVDNERKCCLHLAVIAGNLALVKLFASLFKVDVVDAQGVTPLMLAASNQDSTDIVQFLIGKGADLNLEAGDGSTVLHYAAQCGLVKLLEMLTTKQNINKENAHGKTPLTYCLEKEHLDAVKYLLASGANVTTSDNVSAALKSKRAKLSKQKMV